jgi:hypothetical protein
MMRYVLSLLALLLAVAVRGQTLIVPQSTNEGSVVRITYREIGDPFGTFASEEVTINFGDGTSATNLAAGRFAQLVFDHVYAEDSHFTNYVVTVTEDDFELGLAETIGVIRIANVPPTGFLASDFYVPAGRLNGLVPVNDPGYDWLTGQISYGDGTVQNLDLGMGSGNRSIPLIHTYNATGTYTVSVMVRDDEGGVWSRTAPVTVTGLVPAPSLSIHSFAGLVITGELGQSYDIQKTDSAESTNWTTAATVTLSTNPQLWMDMESTNSVKRFYRATAR